MHRSRLRQSAKLRQLYKYLNGLRPFTLRLKSLGEPSVDLIQYRNPEHTLGEILPYLRRAFLILAAVLCFFAAIILVSTAGLPERANYSGIVTNTETFAPEVGASAPPFTATDVDGETVNLLELRGSTVIINFWATWCGPCAAEMPELQAFYDARQQDEIRLLGVNLGEEPEQILSWVERYGLTFDLLLDLDGAIAELYRLRGQPSTYIVSSEGVITDIFYGPTTYSQLESSIPTS